ncbi:ABC transporter substrate-binding protein [Corynebacterium freiburgense]|uniref:ABC transporter substrate-binding protein n=1 Tax=Corynebacterium freiburgense TaxID=556548 RepID=UPI00041FA1C3|nr:ABC transporter substrate-binding protein [Corynebacterium freiburgense]WJZ01773.1 putative D,D-dipeptide-binding periplasmic protein DdpA precursor [Corynebacterium freiburgense]
MDRRQFLKSATLGAAGSVLAGCGMEIASYEAFTAPAPSKAGQLRIGALGNLKDTIDPATASGPATWAAIYAIFESLVITGPDGPVFQLAKRIEHNEDATLWTIYLRDQATYSDGSAVSALDVIRSYKYLAGKAPFAGLLECLDLAKSKSFDETTAVLRLHEPRFDFIETVLAVISPVFKNGDPTSQVGSGPYVLDGGNAESGWKFKANQHYPPAWRLSNGLEIHTINDADKRIRALNAGDIDLAIDVSANAEQLLMGDAEIWNAGAHDTRNLGFFLHTASSPFDSQDAREAFKLAIDREKLAGVIFDGYGKPGNDLPGQELQGFPRGLRKKRDKDEAKKIFDAASVQKLTITTAELCPGMNDAAFLLVDQFQEVGVELTVEEHDVSTYLSDFGPKQTQQVLAASLPNLKLETAIALYGGPESMFNLSGWGQEGDWPTELAEFASNDTDIEREDMIEQLASTFADKGAFVLWGVRKSHHARAKGIPNVHMHLGIPIVNAVS